MRLGVLFVSVLALAACAVADPDSPEPIDEVAPLDGEALQAGALVSLPSGTLASRVVTIASDGALLDAVTHNDNVYIHNTGASTWYFKSGNYLLGVEAFTQYHQQVDRWIAFGSGDKVAPSKTRIVGHSYRGQGWDIPSLTTGKWPAAANSVWVIGTEDGKFGMGGAPQGIPLGTEVFGAMQTYGGALSTPFLYLDGSPKSDSTRIRGQFAFRSTTLIGGHSAGSTAARRIALDVGLSHTWLYGTPNYSRGSGAYGKTEKNGSKAMVAEVINNKSDPVTHVLATPWNLVSLAWGTAKCHSYSNWTYQDTTPDTVTCP